MKAALFVLTISLLGLIACTPTSSGQALVWRLQHGGCVIVMRHANSPMTPPTAAQADPGNPTRERQLDELGRSTASAMGAALKRLHIPIGQVWSSPTYRALQTVRLAGLPKPKIAAELGDHGPSIEDRAAWPRAKVATPPEPGTNTLVVTHGPNMAAAFGKMAAGLGEGEALIFHAGALGGLILEGRVKIEDWPKLPAQ